MVESERIGVPKTSQAGKIRPLDSSKQQQQQRAGVLYSEARNCGCNLNTYIIGSLAWPNQFLTLNLQAHTQAEGYQNGAAFLHCRPTFYNRLYKYLFCFKKYYIV